MRAPSTTPISQRRFTFTGVPGRLVEEKDWKERASVTFREIENGLPRDEHPKIWADFNDSVWNIIPRSTEYLSVEGDSRSCLEAEARTAFRDMTVEVDTKLAFIMPGSTKQVGDCEDALQRLNKVASYMLLISRGKKN